MKLVWVGDGDLTLDDRRMHPHGYWYARTDDGGYDGSGPDPLTAVSNLVAQIEREKLNDA